MHIYSDNLEHEYKQLRKQLKLMRGLEKAPEEHQPRLKNLLLEIQSKTGLEAEEDISDRLGYLKQLYETHKVKQEKLPGEVITRLWFLRPLLSHLDHPKKIKALSDQELGAAALNDKIYLHIPLEAGHQGVGLDELRNYFSFKGMGRGTVDSRKMQEQFFKNVGTSQKLPFSVPGVTDLPLLYYKLDGLWKEIFENKRPLCIVSGVCPLSLITNEFRFKNAEGGVLRPGLGFGEWKVKGDKSLENFFKKNEKIDVEFPPRPILSDYIELTRLFKLARTLVNKYGIEDVNIRLWIPMHEYYTAMAAEQLSHPLEKTSIEHDQLLSGLNRLAEKYEALINYVRDENRYKGSLGIEVTDKRSFELQEAELETLLRMKIDKITERYVPFVYGQYKGSSLRNRLFALLALKHMLPLLESPDVNVLHLESSYEIWPNLLASIWSEKWSKAGAETCGDKKQVYSWMLTPSIPSPSLKYMRTLNAPYDQKLYLNKNKDELNDDIKALEPLYIRLISSLIIEPGSNFDDQKSIFGALSERIMELNRISRIR